MHEKFVSTLQVRPKIGGTTLTISQLMLGHGLSPLLQTNVDNAVSFLLLSLLKLFCTVRDMTDRQTDGQTDKQMDRWTDRQMDRRTYIKVQFGGTRIIPYYILLLICNH